MAKRKQIFNNPIKHTNSPIEDRSVLLAVNLTSKTGISSNSDFDINVIFGGVCLLDDMSKKYVDAMEYLYISRLITMLKLKNTKLTSLFEQGDVTGFELTLNKLIDANLPGYKNYIECLYLKSLWLYYTYTGKKPTIEKVNRALQISYILGTQRFYITQNSDVDYYKTDKMIADVISNSKLKMGTHVKTPITREYFKNCLLDGDNYADFADLFQRGYTQSLENKQYDIDSLFEGLPKMSMFRELSDVNLDIEKIKKYCEKNASTVESIEEMFSMWQSVFEFCFPYQHRKLQQASFSRCFTSLTKESIQKTTAGRLEAEQKNKEMLKENHILKKTNKKAMDDISKLSNMNSILQKDLNEFGDSKIQNGDYIQLQEDYIAAQQELSNASSQTTKLEGKLQSREQRISRLEGRLLAYTGIEDNLVQLQNENNVLASQIARIESFEEGSEDSLEMYTKKLEAIKDVPILFVGGRGGQLLKFIEIFPNSEVIDLSEDNENFNIPPRIQYVAVYTKMITHSYCDRIDSLVKKDRVVNLNILNKYLVVEELYNHIVGDSAI